MKNIEKFYLINNKKEGYGIMLIKNGSINIDFQKHDLRKGDGIEITKFIELIWKWENEEFLKDKRLILLFKLLISFIFIIFSLYKLGLLFFDI